MLNRLVLMAGNKDCYRSSLAIITGGTDAQYHRGRRVDSTHVHEADQVLRVQVMVRLLLFLEGRSESRIRMQRMHRDNLHMIQRVPEQARAFFQNPKR